MAGHLVPYLLLLVLASVMATVNGHCYDNYQLASECSSAETRVGPDEVVAVAQNITNTRGRTKSLEVEIYMKPEHGFRGVSLLVEGDGSEERSWFRSSTMLFPVQGLWYPVRVLVQCRGRCSQGHFEFNTSACRRTCYGRNLKWKPLRLYLLAHGPSKWKFSRPPKACLYSSSFSSFLDREDMKYMARYGRQRCEPPPPPSHHKYPHQGLPQPLPYPQTQTVSNLMGYSPPRPLPYQIPPPMLSYPYPLAYPMAHPLTYPLTRPMMHPNPVMFPPMYPMITRYLPRLTHPFTRPTIYIGRPSDRNVSSLGRPITILTYKPTRIPTALTTDTLPDTSTERTTTAPSFTPTDTPISTSTNSPTDIFTHTPIDLTTHALPDTSIERPTTTPTDTPINRPTEENITTTTLIANIP